MPRYKLQDNNNNRIYFTITSLGLCVLLGLSHLLIIAFSDIDIILPICKMGKIKLRLVSHKDPAQPSDKMWKASSRHPGVSLPESPLHISNAAMD